ncbi:MAG: hypothetical protein KF689_03085 [Gemmatimonadaceae bacterium]|nr:hypothetical protein [Gemmatimonadaceae bacterium]MCW5827543.1 hypothetical protein [Gemmatimonadaceae bacterium]
MARRFRLLRAAALAAVVVAVLGCRETTPSIEPVVRAHLERYPLAGLEDLYSALLHGALGPAHGTGDSAGAANWLQRELATLPAGPAEPIAEAIAGDTSVVRLNLRPFLAAGGAPDSLLVAFLRSGRSVTPRPFRLAHGLRELAELADAGTLPWNGDSVRSFLRRVTDRDHELLGHSSAYLEAYRPAYRVVSRPELARLFPEKADDELFVPTAPPFPTGSFVDDYGAAHEISATEWRHGYSTPSAIRAWHPSRRYLLAETVPAADTSRGTWMRIDWVPLDGAPWEWAYCIIAYDKVSAAMAEADTSARPATPRTGCGRFPFTRLRRAEAASR